MAKSPKKPEAPEGDPKRGDEILKRMLQTRPKQHKDMVAERKGDIERRKQIVPAGKKPAKR